MISVLVTIPVILPSSTTGKASAFTVYPGYAPLPLDPFDTSLQSGLEKASRIHILSEINFNIVAESFFPI